MDQSVAKYCIGQSLCMKKCWWAPFAWMLDIFVQNGWILYQINCTEEDQFIPYRQLEERFWIQFFWNILMMVQANDKWAGFQSGMFLTVFNTTSWSIIRFQQRNKGDAKFARKALEEYVSDAKWISMMTFLIFFITTSVYLV